jgi:hypothetical protein
VSFLQKLEQARAVAIAREGDPWRLPLARLRGQIGDDGVERITTQVVLDVLEVPQSRRRAGTYRRLAKLMAELGWSAVRVRGLTRGGYLEQVRGFARLPAEVSSGKSLSGLLRRNGRAGQELDPHGLQLVQAVITTAR